MVTFDRRRWWLLFATLSVSLGLFTLLPPPMTGADEFWHLIRVAAVAGGELTGEREPSGDGWFYEVETPSGYDGRLLEMILCLNVNADEDARCSGEVPARGAPAITRTPYGNYPPLYYIAVSPATLRGSVETGMRLARLGTAVLAAGLLASAFSAAFERRWRWVLCGLAVALTQAVVLAMTTVNPNAFEVAAAALVWVALPSLLLTERTTWRDSARVAVGGAALALARPSSMLWVAGIVVAVVLFVGWRRTIAVARTRAGLWPAATVAAAGVVALLWYRWAEYDEAFGWSAALGAGVRALDLSEAELVRRSLDSNFSRVRFIFWGFGDVYAPTARWLALLIGATWAGLLALGVWAGRWWRAALLITLALAVPLLSTVLELRYIELLGDWFQPRYIMPVAVGVPVLCGLAIDRSTFLAAGSHRLEIARRVLVLASTVLFAVASWLFLRRFAVGVHGPAFAITGADAWNPPVNGWVLIAALAVSRLALARLVLADPGEERASLS